MTRYNFYPFLFTMLTLSGCYGTGSMFTHGPLPEVFDAAQLRKIDRVCIMPVTIAIDETHATASISLTDSVWRLVNYEHIVRLVPSDSTRAAIKSIPNTDTLGYQTLARQLNADTFLRMVIVLSHSAGPRKEPAATCLLMVYDAMSGKKLMNCIYDTYLEKDYWFGNAKIEQVTHDAINGAIQTFSKIVKENGQVSTK